MEAATFSIQPLRLSPLDADESQLVQQSTAGTVRIVAQVQVQLRAFWRRLEAQAALFCLQVALQGYCRCPRRDFAQPLADFQSIPDQLHRLYISVAQYRLYGLVQPCQSRQ